MIVNEIRAVDRFGRPQLSGDVAGSMSGGGEELWRGPGGRLQARGTSDDLVLAGPLVEFGGRVQVDRRRYRRHSSPRRGRRRVPVDPGGGCLCLWQAPADLHRLVLAAEPDNLDYRADSGPVRIVSLTR